MTTCWRWSGAVERCVLRPMTQADAVWKELVVTRPGQRKCKLVMGLIVVAACAATLVLPGPAGARHTRYCEKPGGPGNFLAASPDVTCAAAHKVIARVFSPACVHKTRCAAYGFRCVAYWSGGFDQPFSYTNHAVCNDRWRWIFYDGG